MVLYSQSVVAIRQGFKEERSMPKFCTVCGASIPDDATFCTNCGSPQGQPAPAPAFQQTPSPQQPAGPSGQNSAAYSMLNAINQGQPQQAYQQPAAAAPRPGLSDKAKKGIILGIAGIAAVAVIVILLIVLLSGGYKKPVDDLVKALETGKGEYYIKTLAESERKSREEDFAANSSKFDSLEEFYDDRLSSSRKSLADRYGDDFSISYSITDKKEVSDSRLKSYASEYLSDFGKKVDVTAGYTLRIEVNWKGSKKDEDGDKSITVLKVDGDWVLYDADYDTMLPRKLGGDHNSSSSVFDDYDLDDLDDLDDLGDLGDMGDLGDVLDYFS